MLVFQTGGGGERIGRDMVYVCVLEHDRQDKKKKNKRIQGSDFRLILSAWTWVSLISKESWRAGAEDVISSISTTLTRLLITPVTRGKPALSCLMSSSIIAKHSKQTSTGIKHDQVNNRCVMKFVLEEKNVFWYRLWMYVI